MKLPKPEGRKALKDRLTAEGRWDEYLEKREQLRKTLPLEEANAQAAALFPPLPPGTAAAPLPTPPPKRTAAPVDASTETTAADFANKDTSISTRDILTWVANNYSRSDLTPADAPSPGAWNLAKAVAANPRMVEIFWGSMWTKMLPSQKELDELLRQSDKGGLLTNLLDEYDRLEAILQAKLTPTPTPSPPPSAVQHSPSDILPPNLPSTHAAALAKLRVPHHPPHSPALAPEPGQESGSW